ncbi:hypothetical protein [Methylobacterium dankookense]|uniref:Uncharacterized protein n=1 Tax=Methylobacterium dankookense TaxID=560405 RepID=A0A564G3R6_9HYPH|nr:hypothetical protein [Methylobacterium dankookense]GJD59647.1 hypothetical protein IFDJLNFL_5577 [Methylobacterium dankookense]VUF15139.1 hypothetical protein MTDSW087_04874 [Methylobacterium dankookense]
MNAARPFRWLLALAALFVPTAMACRDGGLTTEAGAQAETPAEVVFRHYL